MSTNIQLIGPFTQVIPMTGLSLKGALKDDSLRVIQNGGILIEGDSIREVGEFEKLAKKARQLNAVVHEIEHPQVALPGLIDAHTHICFSGSRAKDYARRNGGMSYLEIAKAGGGIWDSVSQTRKKDQVSLTKGVISRSQRLLKSGITTAEVKSGYGLSVEEELKMLRAIKDASNNTTVDLISTCLAAHIFPKDYDGSISDYLKEISEKVFPTMLADGLGNRVDAFIEQEAFTPSVIEPYLQAAQSLGFDITIHADQFHVGGSAVAVKFKARSADHLEASGAKEINLLANSDVIAVALPGASIGLGCDFTPARRLLDAGAALAIASDWNPGSAPMGDLITQAAILGTFEKLSNTELLSGITFRAAAVLNLSDRGLLESGMIADVISFSTDNYQEILYQQGQLKPNDIWKKGRRITV